MIKSAYLSIGSALVMSALAAIMPAAALAQTVMGGTAAMPALFNSQGIEVNNGNTVPLPAGTYWLQPGGQAIDYYGNGLFYNPSTGLYGGSTVYDPNGTAGVSLGYSAMVENPASVTAVAPSAPNTGAGGGAPGAWAAILASGAVVIAGLAYVASYSFRRMSADA